MTAQPTPTTTARANSPAPVTAATEADAVSVGVVGGGLGGLAAACTLAARGHRVTLYERNGWFGGKAATLDEAGYHFDMGPTILIMPSVLRRVFSEAGRDLDDYLELVELDPQWRCFYEDGAVLDLTGDRTRMRDNLEALAPGTGLPDGYERFMATSARLERISNDFFLWRSVGSVRDTLSLGETFSPAVLADLVAMRFGKTVAETVRRDIKDPRAAQMVDHFTQYVGSSPAASPAVLCGIANMQVGEGVWYPIGGTGAIPAALARLARELGVEMVQGRKVERIRAEAGRARTVVTNAGERRFDAVVTNADAVRSYRELLEGAPRVREKYANRDFEPACSGVVLYLGLKKRYEHLLHHNFVFSKDPEEEFRQIYDEGVPADDPTAYVCAPSLTEPGVAPEGGEALYVLVHTPYLRPGQDWSEMLPGYREKILDKLESCGGMTGLRDNIVVERTLTPQDINDRYSVLDGAIYGLASHGRFAGAFKPANRSPELDGLYLAGGAAHPGPGMPMALMSGWIAADSLHEDRAKLASGAGTGGGGASRQTGAATARSGDRPVEAA